MRADRVMAEGGERIDLGAPLRSVRRADALPYHKADLKSGPDRHPGAVPFVWEQRPGQPKSVRTRRPPRPPPPPPPTSSLLQPLEDGGEEEIDTSPYHDALGDRGREALHGVAAYGSRTTGASARKEGETVVDAKKEVKTQEAVAVAAVLRKEEDDDDEEEEEKFSDALDTLSRTGSFTVNCSVSGLSGMPDPAPGAAAGAAAGAEPGARGFMMDRFLPAAQAVAVGTPQYTFRKAGATDNSGRELARASAVNVSTGSGDDRARRAPVQLPYQHLPPNYLSCNCQRREEREEEEEDDDDYDVHSTRGFASKGCGLLPSLCVKSSLLLLNPVPAMKRGKARGRDRGLPSKGRGQKAPSPLARSSQNRHLGCDSNGQSWEEVYKCKLEQKCLRQVEDGRSKLTSESNQLTFSSDLQTGDGSSPFYHSIGGGVSPYHRDVVVSPSSKANGSFGIGDKDEKMCRSNGSSSLGRDHDRGSLVGSDHSSLKGSSSMSSGLDRTVHEDSMDHSGDIVSETSHLALLLDSKVYLNASGYDSQLEGRQIAGRNPIGKGQDNNPLTERISKVTEPTLLTPSGKPASVILDDRKPFAHGASLDGPLQSEDSTVVKTEIMPLQPLLPLPIPKSPSESWLSRTLLSVTNKPPVPSFLGIQVQPKKQAPWSPMHSKENDLKPSRPRKIRFADVVERPNSLDSEI